MPLYMLGFMGATRRLDHYEAETGWHPLFIVAAAGVCIIALGMTFQVLQLIVSIKRRKENLDTSGDPWNGRTLEWSTASPPPLYNFAIVPEVHSRDAFWEAKQEQKRHRPSKPVYHDIHMPKDSPMGLFIALFGFLFCFAVIWLILWLAIVSFAGVLACLIVRLSSDDIDYYLPAAEVEAIEAKTANRGASPWPIQ